jgi:hypothetical protein
MPLTLKKTTTVTTTSTVCKGGKTVSTTETTTSTSDGSDKEAAEFEQAARESHEAASKLVDSFSAQMDAIFEPFRRLRKRAAKR